MKHYTSIEQSEKLLELGLSPETADMFYNEEPDETYRKDIVDTKYPMIIREGQKHYLEEYGIPCWSFGALFDLMPKIKEFYYPSLYKCSFDVTACMYSTQEHDIFKIYTGKDSLEAAFNMVVWLLENNYINKINNGKA